MLNKTLGAILAAANSDPLDKQWFYEIKERVLKRWGLLVAWDQQHIVKKCWSCDDGIFHGYDNGLYWVEREPQACTRCQATGIYDQFWVLLEVWHLGGHEFHRPMERVHGKPTSYSKGWISQHWLDYRNHIKGYIKHDPHPRARAAFWFLVWVFTPVRAIKELVRIRINRIRWAWSRVKSRIRFAWVGESEIPF